MVIMPIFTAQAIEAVFRFLFDADQIRKSILLSSVWFIIILGSLICGVTIGIINKFIFTIPYSGWLFLYYMSTVVVTMYQRVARSIGKSIQFAISGILNSITVITFQIITLIFFSASVEGLMIAYAISAVITCVYLEYHTNSLRVFSLSKVDLKAIKEILNYGLPLIPNNISWWAVSTVNKMMIVAYLGIGANGVFAITAKFTSILSILTEVFRLSWQESAIIAYDEENRTQFYSNTFNKYIIFLFVGCCALLPIIKILLPILVTQEYREAWIYIPPSIFGVCLSSLAAFYGAGYSASQKTKDAFGTTIVGAIINIIVCILLIEQIGLFAPAVSTIAAYLSICVLRQIRMKDYFKINVSINNVFICITICVISTVIYYFSNYILNIVMCLVLIGFLVITNKTLIIFVLSKFRRKKIG
jgi:O-antigen/teichoic acid export membrane protein